MIKTFEQLINTGVESLEMVADAKEKAAICAELAKAIAMSGLLTGAAPAVEVKETKEEKKKTTKKNTKKDALKPEASKGESAPAVIEEEPVATPQEPVVTEPEVSEPEVAPTTNTEIVDEWTDEMVELKAEQLQRLNDYVEAWEADYVYNDCLGAMTEGVLVGAENVRPSNIDGFLAYLDALAASMQ